MKRKKYVIVVSGLGNRVDTKDIMKWLKRNDLFERGAKVATYRFGNVTISSDYWILTKEMSVFDLAKLGAWMQISCVGHISNVYFLKYAGQNPKDYYKVKE